ncbi:energy transducer TonB [Isoptericola jiangsuensis]|uniref:energy transducer TonB n=1 Tax=Isoptericola jiangsuensis TaxID=548579 RepID=UPI003865AF30
MAAGIALLLAALAALVWYFLFQDPVTSRRPVADTPMLMLPPPPPPPPEPPPEPEPVEEETMPEPEPLDEAPTPAEEEDAPTPDNSDPVTMDADAQAGTDSFGIQSGAGGGMRGTGTGGAGNASYGRWLGYALQQVISRDERARRHAFQLQLEVWLDRDGVITRVELARGSGNAEADAAVLEAVRNLGRVDERPPASLTFPARVLVQGRRPAG